MTATCCIAAGPKAGGNAPLEGDATVRARLVGVSRDRFVGFEVQIALDGKAERAAQLTEFAHADVAEFWET